MREKGDCFFEWFQVKDSEYQEKRHSTGEFAVIISISYLTGTVGYLDDFLNK